MLTAPAEVEEDKTCYEVEGRKSKALIPRQFTDAGQIVEREKK